MYAYPTRLSTSFLRMLDTLPAESCSSQGKFSRRQLHRRLVGESRQSELVTCRGTTAIAGGREIEIELALLDIFISLTFASLVH